jgi:hypothetical protein
MLGPVFSRAFFTPFSGSGTCLGDIISNMFPGDKANGEELSKKHNIMKRFVKRD